MADLTSSTSGIKPMIFNAGTTLGATSFDDYIFSIKSTCAMKSKKHAQIFDEDVDDYELIGIFFAIHHNSRCSTTNPQRGKNW